MISESMPGLAWIPAADRARLDAALRRLRPLAPRVRERFEQVWGPDWDQEVRRRLRTSFPTGLEDTRFLLRVLSDERVEPNPAAAAFPDLPAGLVRQLRDLANKAFHEDLSWRPGVDADRAERLVDAILSCSLPARPMAVLTVTPDHHQEVFLIDEAGRLRHRWYPDEHRGRWSSWHVMPTPVQPSAVAATGSGDGTGNVFILAPEGRVEHRLWTLEDDGWGDWITLSSGEQAVTGPLVAMSRDPLHIELFATGEDGLPVHRWLWDGTWSPWHRFALPS